LYLSSEEEDDDEQVEQEEEREPEALEREAGERLRERPRRSVEVIFQSRT
jgi:hypothetical protein